MTSRPSLPVTAARSTGGRTVQIVGQWGFWRHTSDSGDTVQDNPLSASATTLNVSDGANFVVGHTLLVESEQLYVTAIATNAGAEVMKAFKAGACQILIATDVSARGIDIPDVHYVLNYDLPDKAENYVHRVGRTGRGVKKGTAISFCSKEEKSRLEEIQGYLDQEIDVIELTKKDYAFTVTHPSGEHTLEELLKEIDREEEEKREKKKKRKPQKRKKKT